MDKYTPPPQTLSERILAMEPQTTILITESPYTSVKTVVSRIRNASKPARKYRTSKRTDCNGTRVWRDA